MNSWSFFQLNFANKRGDLCQKCRRFHLIYVCSKWGHFCTKFLQICRVGVITGIKPIERLLFEAEIRKTCT